MYIGGLGKISLFTAPVLSIKTHRPLAPVPVPVPVPVPGSRVERSQLSHDSPEPRRAVRRESPSHRHTTSRHALPSPRLLSNQLTPGTVLLSASSLSFFSALSTFPAHLNRRPEHAISAHALVSTNHRHRPGAQALSTAARSSYALSALALASRVVALRGFLPAPSIAPARRYSTSLPPRRCTPRRYTPSAPPRRYSLVVVGLLCEECGRGVQPELLERLRPHRPGKSLAREVGNQVALVTLGLLARHVVEHHLQ